MATRIRERKQRIDLLARMLDERGNESVKKVLARFCVQTGVTLFTAKRYLELLKDAEAVQIASED